MYMSDRTQRRASIAGHGLGTQYLFAMCILDFADSDDSGAWESRRTRGRSTRGIRMEWRENSLLMLFIGDGKGGF